MNYSMKTPCNDCPFRRAEGAIRIDKGRARAIAKMMTDSQGGTFPCHKTTCFDEDGEHDPHDKEIHCAGALIFAEKNGNATQIMRWMERIGAYDARALMTDNPAVDEVFDTVMEMVAANDTRYIPPQEGKALLGFAGRRRPQRHNPPETP